MLISDCYLLFWFLVILIFTGCFSVHLEPLVFESFSFSPGQLLSPSSINQPWWGWLRPRGGALQGPLPALSGALVLIPQVHQGHLISVLYQPNHLLCSISRVSRKHYHGHGISVIPIHYPIFTGLYYYFFF